MKKICMVLALCLAVTAGMAQKGKYQYSGKKINLEENTFSCQLLTKLQGIEKQGYQGVEVWGDYLFSFQNTGYLTVYQLDGDKVSKVTDPFKIDSYNKNNHCNVASFGNIFYDKADKFPLIYVSQCQRGTINGRKDVLYVERIANDMKSTSLIQTIYFKDVKHLFGYALQWVIDRENNYLYGYGNTVDNTNPLNRHRVVKFRVPSLDESTDGMVTLTEDDLLENYLIEDTYQTYYNPIGQGLYINNGLLFMPTGFGTEKAPSILYVWDLKTRTMQNVIDLSKATTGELESCAYHRGSLVMQTQGSLYRLTF